MLWDIIRDFFVQYIFGGTTSSGQGYSGFIGYDYLYEARLHTSDTLVVFNNIMTQDGDFDAPIMFLSIGDWLSTSATIIILCLVILFFIKLTIWFFKQGAGLFKW